MVLLPKRHGVDLEVLVLRKNKDDHLQHVPGAVRSNNEDLRWIGVRIEVDHDDRMIDGVLDVFVTDTVSSSRLLNLHTRLV